MSTGCILLALMICGYGFSNGNSVSGNFMFESATHGDFLGSILGTGVTRDKVGDIIMQVPAFCEVCHLVKFSSESSKLCIPQISHILCLAGRERSPDFGGS